VFVNATVSLSVAVDQCFPTLFSPLTIITYEQQYFSQKCLFILVARPIKSEQMTYDKL